MSLTKSKCAPCEGGISPLSDEEAKKYLKDISGWSKIDNKIQKEFDFKKYLDGLEFVYSVGKLADNEGHHPDVYLGYNKVKITLTTHAINGLSKNDFILAAKIDEIAS